MVGFVAPDRTVEDRRLIRQAHLSMTQSAWGLVGRMRCVHSQLLRELKQYNRTYTGFRRLQLRDAANVGPVMSDEIGVSGGKAIIRRSRWAG